MGGDRTICAVATALGRGGIGVVRVSGVGVAKIGRQMLGELPQARFARYGAILDEKGVVIDEGIAIFYPAPHSFTGEDVLELQGHGGILVIQQILAAAVALGAEAAEAGEFSKRAFLNGKMDLVQAEAVADLIEAGSNQSAKSALKSLSGEFSAKINILTKSLIELRVFAEAMIDFADEQLDLPEFNKMQKNTADIENKIQDILTNARLGAILREGLFVAIVGKPNAGKSSLLNALTQESSAIVTDIAGTTRDVLRETIHINGMPLNIIDTAGLRHSEDEIEVAGINKTHQQIEAADVILLVFDANDGAPDLSILQDNTGEASKKPLLLIKNKIDLLGEKPQKTTENNLTSISICAKNSEGVDLLRNELFNMTGLEGAGDGVVLARKRHIVALKTALSNIQNAKNLLANQVFELAAEDYRQAAKALGSITGEFTSDDLLGEIFSTFCIGK